MEENNSQQIPKEPTKKEKAEQAGKDVAEVAAKGAANYFAGPVGGAIVDKVAQTKLGQNVLNAAGKNLSKNPLTKNALAKAQPAIQQAKPMLNQAAGSLGGNTAGAASGAKEATSATKASNDSNLTSSTSNSNKKSDNSGFGNNKSGLFSPFSNSSNQSSSGTASGDLGQSLKKAKKIMGIIAAVAPIVLPLIIVVLIVAAIMSQIMTAVEFLGEVETGIEKYVNFAQGHGWLTNEEYFFKHLENEYNDFSKTVSEGELDIPLVAATIHYSKVVDTDILGDVDINEDKGYTTDDFESLGQFLGGDQTASFYNIAADKLGSVNTLFPGQKRLLGHVVETEIKIGFTNWETAKTEWTEYFNLINQTLKSTLGDAWEEQPFNIPNLIDAFNTMVDYANQNDDAFAGLKYDAANRLYELKEFGHLFTEAFASLGNLETDENGEYTEEQKGAFPTPIVIRRANYGYDEYKQMKEDMLQIKSILSKSGVEYKSDVDALKKAGNSSNTELKRLYDSFNANERDYKYSYTHYLRTLYIPFTYFYGKEYTTQQIDTIVDEIYDQRDFYNYLVADTKIETGLQLGRDGYQIRVSAPTKENPYFNYPYVGTNIGQCVWYVKGRATEIIANAEAPEDKKQKALETMKTMYGNGNQWYSEHLTSVFGSGQDYKQPKPGAIAVYDWVNPDEKGNRYGHSVIVEKVEGDTVYITEGWNSCGGAYGTNSWDCVGFSYHSLTVEQMKNLGSSKYAFIGYVYLLD